MRGIWSLTLGLALAATAAAADGPLRWYGGDCNVPVWPAGSFTAADRAEQAADGGLDWYALATPIPSSALGAPGAPDRFAALADKGPTPLLALRWRRPVTITQDIICLGLDPDLPLPEPKPSRMTEWADRAGALAILTNPGRKLKQYARRLPALYTFEAFSDGKWNPACSVGGAWDELLAEGRRLCIVGGSDDPDRPVLGTGAVTTYVLARSRAAADVVAGLRAGRVAVAERDAIRLSFTVDGAPPGSVVIPADRKVHVALSVRPREPVDEVHIIGNTMVDTGHGVAERVQVLHRIKPEGRRDLPPVELPVSKTTRYLRAEAVARKSGCRTLTNPVFLGGSAPDPPRADVVDRGVDLVAAALDMLDWEEDPAFARKVVERLLVDRRVDAHTVFYLARRFSEPQLDRIRPLLSSGEGAAPAMVAAVFVKLKRKRALPDILPLLDGGHAVARLYAGRMLVRHGTAAHKAWALRAARDHSADVRQYGVAALARIADEESLLRLRAGLGDWAEQVRETAATELAHVAGIAPGEVEAFVEDFKKGDVGRATVDDVVANEALRPILLAVARKKVPRIKLAAPRAARRAEAVRRLAARWSPRRPKIDGRADDRAWADAAPAGRFTLDDGGAPRHQTTVSAIYDEDALYLLFQCDEPDIDRLITLYTETDSNVWLDDSIDIYLFPRGTEKEGSPPYYRLSANARGTQFDERRRNRDWNASWAASASKGEKGWTLEVSVPFRNFLIRRPDRNKTTWRVNFVRHRRIPPEEDSVFQKGDPREPATNAVLKFE